MGCSQLTVFAGSWQVGAVKHGDVMRAGITGFEAPIEVEVPVVSTDALDEESTSTAVE